MHRAERNDAPALPYAALVVAVGRLLDLDPGYGRRVARALADDNLEAGLRAAIVADLRRAGLELVAAGAPACRLVEGPAA